MVEEDDILLRARPGNWGPLVGTSRSSSVLCRARPSPSPCKLPSPRTRHHASLHTKCHLVCRDGGGGNDAYLTDKKMVGQDFREGAEPGSLHPRLSCLLPPSIRDPHAGVSVVDRSPSMHLFLTFSWLLCASKSKSGAATGYFF